MFTPLSFVYGSDERTVEIEDELLFGSSIILAPVYKQNSNGRMVYLPEDALEVRVKSASDIKISTLTKGDHYIKVALDEVVFFVIKGGIVPILDIDYHIKNITSLDLNKIKYINNGYKYDKYELYYEDDNEVKSKR